MTSIPTFTITCERCGRKDHQRAYFTVNGYGINDAGKFVALPEKQFQMGLEEAREFADTQFLMEGWSVAGLGKMKADMCPDCLKQWKELGDDYVLEPTSEKEYERTGHMMEFMYKGKEDP